MNPGPRTFRLSASFFDFRLSCRVPCFARPSSAVRSMRDADVSPACLSRLRRARHGTHGKVENRKSKVEIGNDRVPVVERSDPTANVDQCSERPEALLAVGCWLWLWLLALLQLPRSILHLRLEPGENRAVHLADAGFREVERRADLLHRHLLVVVEDDDETLRS